MRNAVIERNTAETQIKIALNLDEFAVPEIDTGCGFLDHMLTLFGSHSRFGLKVDCKGDTYVDYHHTVEDVGIALGQAFAEAVGDKAGICRYGDIMLPMDEALILCAVDISGRAHLEFGLDLPAAKVGDFDTELVREFFLGFVRAFPMALHIRSMAGVNTHHIIEGGFKAFARVMKQALAIDPTLAGAIPSTKGVL